MIRRLSFKADPATSYHTLDYHLRKAKKHKFLESCIDEDTRQGIVSDTVISLYELLEVPRDFNMLFHRTGLQLYQAMSRAVPGDIAVIDTNCMRESFQKIKNITILPDINMGKLKQKTSRYTKDSSLPDGKTLTNVVRKDSKHQRVNKFSDTKVLAGFNETEPGHLTAVCFEDLNPFTGRKTDIKAYRDKYGLSTVSMIHCDISYSVPTEILGFDRITSFSFQTQFGFGMPPGLSVWIARKEIFKKILPEYSKNLEVKYYCLPDYGPAYIHSQVDIDILYAFGMIVKDMLNRGIMIIRNEIKYKSIILYNAIKASMNLELMIDDPDQQSQNIIFARTKADIKYVVDYFNGHGVELDIYTDEKEVTILRIANYPVHSKEQVEYLSDLLTRF